MTTMAQPLDTAKAVLDDAAALRVMADRAEQTLMLRACEWADLHPPLDDSDGSWDERELDPGVPDMAWDATAEFALAIGLSDSAGKRLIREALEVRHRLPRVWRRVLSGQVQAWRARRIAQRVIGLDPDVADHLDSTLAPIAHKVGPITLGRLIDEAMMRLHPEERELQQLEALDHQHVTLYDGITETGLGEMQIRADWKDLHDFDQMVSIVAAALADAGSPEPLDVRRAMAVGILADPDAAAEFLAGATITARRKRVVVHVHLSEAALLGLDPVGRVQTGGDRPALVQQVAMWCGRADTDVVVRPVVDPCDHERVEQYEIPDRMVTRNELLHPRCVFPWCTRPSRRCDKDHGIPHAAGGATCDCNLAPLCRRHHRLKTHRRWRYTTIEPGVYLWTSPAGRSYLRDQTGTEDLAADAIDTPATGPPYDGCQLRPD